MLKRLLQVFDKKSFFLFGPRGTGKTSWVKADFHEAFVIDLLKNRDYLFLRADPSRLENLITQQKSNIIVIDEVQKIPELLDEVHRLIETYQYIFILTGSSSRKLKHGSANCCTNSLF